MAEKHELTLKENIILCCFTPSCLDVKYWFVKEGMCCCPLSVKIVNEALLVFELLIDQKKQFEDVTLSSRDETINRFIYDGK